MTLSLADIQNAKNDEDLFQQLFSALSEVFPPELRDNRDQFYAALVLLLAGCAQWLELKPSSQQGP
jgi:hypothetical protein